MVTLFLSTKMLRLTSEWCPEIDHNFARAHRIVTTSILPVVERYSKESDAVWEGSRVRTMHIDSLD